MAELPGGGGGWRGCCGVAVCVAPGGGVGGVRGRGAEGGVGGQGGADRGSVYCILYAA